MKTVDICYLSRGGKNLQGKATLGVCLVFSLVAFCAQVQDCHAQARYKEVIVDVSGLNSEGRPERTTESQQSLRPDAISISLDINELPLSQAELIHRIEKNRSPNNSQTVWIHIDIHDAHIPDQLTPDKLAPQGRQVGRFLKQLDSHLVDNLIFRGHSDGTNIEHYGLGEIGPTDRHPDAVIIESPRKPWADWKDRITAFPDTQFISLTSANDLPHGTVFDLRGFARAQEIAAENYTNIHIDRWSQPLSGENVGPHGIMTRYDLTATKVHVNGYFDGKCETLYMNDTRVGRLVKATLERRGSVVDFARRVMGMSPVENSMPDATPAMLPDGSSVTPQEQATGLMNDGITAVSSPDTESARGASYPSVLLAGYPASGEARASALARDGAIVIWPRGRETEKIPSEFLDSVDAYLEEPGDKEADPKGNRGNGFGAVEYGDTIPVFVDDVRLEVESGADTFTFLGDYLAARGAGNGASVQGPVLTTEPKFEGPDATTMLNMVEHHFSQHPKAARVVLVVGKGKKADTMARESLAKGALLFRLDAETTREEAEKLGGRLDVAAVLRVGNASPSTTDSDTPVFQVMVGASAAPQTQLPNQLQWESEEWVVTPDPACPNWYLARRAGNPSRPIHVYDGEGEDGETVARNVATRAPRKSKIVLMGGRESLVVCKKLLQALGYKVIVESYTAADDLNKDGVLSKEERLIAAARRAEKHGTRWAAILDDPSEEDDNDGDTDEGEERRKIAAIEPPLSPQQVPQLPHFLEADEARRRRERERIGEEAERARPTGTTRRRSMASRTPPSPNPSQHRPMDFAPSPIVQPPYGDIGGVMLSGAATIDGNDGEVSIVGGNFSFVVDGENARISPEAFRKFITALWCVYYAEEDPGISIDPISPNLDKHAVRYIGRVINTDLGRVMREADYVMKKWVVGTEKPDISGFADIDALFRKHGVPPVGVSRRFWFVPRAMNFTRAGDVLLFSHGAMEVKTEFVDQSRFQGSTPADQAFAQFFTDNYDRIAAEYPIFKQLFEYAKLVALAKDLKAKGVPLHWFLMANKHLVLTEDSPSMVAQLAKDSEYFRGLVIEGGVDMTTEGSYVVDEELAQVIRDLRKEPQNDNAATPMHSQKAEDDGTPKPFSFDVREKSYSVIPPYTLTSGKDQQGRRYQTDIALRQEGRPSLELVRYFDPRDRAAGQFGRGWRLLIPYHLEPEGDSRRPFLNAVIPEKMAVVNLLTGRREVLTFDEERLGIGAYVPEEGAETQTIGLILMSNASFRLADKLGNQFHFDPALRLIDIYLSPWREYHTTIKYLDEFTSAMVERPYTVRWIEGKRVPFLNAHIPEQIEVTDRQTGYKEVLTFDTAFSPAAYRPTALDVGRFEVGLLLSDGGLQIVDKNGNQIRFDPTGRFESIICAPGRRMVRSIAMGNRKATFSYKLDPDGRMMIAAAGLSENKRYATPTHAVRYQHDNEGRLCGVHRSETINPVGSNNSNVSK